MIAHAADPRSPLVQYPVSVVEYPETDGEPVAETDIHIDELLSLRSLLKERYRDVPDAYAAGNLLIYYEEGNLAARFSPDVFVVFGVRGHARRIYKLWEEGHPPAFVLEVSSRGTRLVDADSKKALCARLGIREYFLFDPEGDYLDPPLQGYRLEAGDYRRVAPELDRSLRSEGLGLLFRVERFPDRLQLRCIDAATGERLLRPEEQARARARAEQERLRAEQARGDAEARAHAAEKEVRRLRELLSERGEG